MDTPDRVVGELGVRGVSEAEELASSWNSFVSVALEGSLPTAPKESSSNGSAEVNAGT
jgi:hypothetical protein